MLTHSDPRLGQCEHHNSGSDSQMTQTAPRLRNACRLTRIIQLGSPATQESSRGPTRLGGRKLLETCGPTQTNNSDKLSITTRGLTRINSQMTQTALKLGNACRLNQIIQFSRRPGSPTSLINTNSESLEGDGNLPAHSDDESDHQLWQKC